MATKDDTTTVELIWKFSNAEPARRRDGLTTWTLTTGAVDRDHERVYVPGVDCSEFDANPVALGYHEARMLPIGRWENRRVVGTAWSARMMAELRPAPSGVSAAADEVNGLIAAGMLKACSIGFQSLERQVGPNGTTDHMRTLLLEASICAIGANPEALLAAAFGRKRPAPVSPEPVLYLCPNPAPEPRYSRDEIKALLPGAVRAALGAAVAKRVCDLTGALDSEAALARLPAELRDRFAALLRGEA